MKTSIHGDLQLVFVFKCKCALPWEYIHVLCYYRRRPSAFLFFPFLLKNFPKTAGLKISLGPPLWVTWNSGLTFRSTRCFALACSYSSSLCAQSAVLSVAPLSMFLCGSGNWTESVGLVFRCNKAFWLTFSNLNHVHTRRIK